MTQEKGRNRKNKWLWERTEEENNKKFVWENMDKALENLGKIPYQNIENDDTTPFTQLKELNDSQLKMAY